MSPYVYVGDNPIDRIDPDGNCPPCDVPNCGNCNVTTPIMGDVRDDHGSQPRGGGGFRNGVQGAADAETKAGVVVEAAGWTAAATGQEYLDFLIPVGAAMGGGGAVTSGLVDLSKGNTKSGLLKIGTTAIFGAASAKIDALKTASKIPKIEHTILGATNYAFGRIADKMVDEATEKKASTKQTKATTKKKGT